MGLELVDYLFDAIEIGFELDSVIEVQEASDNQVVLDTFKSDLESVYVLLLPAQLHESFQYSFKHGVEEGCLYLRYKVRQYPPNIYSDLHSVVEEHVLKSLHHLSIIEHLLGLEFGTRTKIRQNPASLLSDHWFLMMQVLLKEIQNACSHQRIVFGFELQTDTTNNSYTT